MTSSVETATEIRPFSVSVREEELVELRRRVVGTRWPDRNQILQHFFATGVGYANEMANRPQTLYAIADSPVGLAAWMLDHDERSYQLIARAFAGNPGGLSRDDVLDNITHYWLTNTAVSSARLYWGEPSGLFRRQGRGDPGRGHRVPRRAVSGSAQLGGAGLPQAHPLQPSRRRPTLRRLGAAANPLPRTPRHLQVTTLIAPAVTDVITDAICEVGGGLP